MALKDLWQTSPEQLQDKQVQQIIAFAGSGKLRDGSPTSKEFRDFLSYVPSDYLARYVDDCLSHSFTDNGLALQDVVNQIGRRLGYRVTDGYYRGKKGIIGFDGLWRLSNGPSIVIEVKTTDTYRIDLNILAGYRRRLIEENTIGSDESSILIVVGRQDTGDLEAQIRGSRFAWDVRLISIDALCRLMRLKEDVEDPAIVRQIGEILIPREYTRLDSIIDIVFSTAEDVQKKDEQLDEDLEEERPKETKPKFTPSKFHDACIERVQNHLKQTLVKQSRVVYATPDGKTTVLCAVSKTHSNSSSKQYWFAFHPHQRSTLAEANNADIAFGCGSASHVILVPFSVFEKWLDGMNQTVREDRAYWHVKIVRDHNKFSLKRKQGTRNIDLQSYLLPLDG